MARNEKLLLEKLVEAVATINDQKNKVKKEENLIEKYRDSDGFINVKNVKDMTELKKIFDIVDKKNYMEHFKNGNNLQDLADSLALELLPFTGNGVINLKLETPDGSACTKINNLEDKKETLEQNNVKLEAKNSDETLNSVAVSPINEEPELVVLYSVGGMVNPEFYNALLYICQEKYFPNSDVCANDEIDDKDNVTTHILLPNIWGKMYAAYADEFSLRFDEGDKVFIINPETFELTQITESIQLWDYAMTKVQEETLYLS